MIAHDVKTKLGFLLEPEIEDVGESVAEQQLRRELLLRLQGAVNDFLTENKDVIQELAAIQRKERFLDIFQLFIPDFILVYSFGGK